MIKNVVFGLQLIYLPTLIFTNISLTGYYTDLIALITISILSHYWFVFKKEKTPQRALSILYAGVTSFWLFSVLINPFSWNQLKVTTFDVEVNDNYFTLNYFQPVGSWGCGYGSYWETQTLLYFPILEWETKSIPCVHEDYGFYIKSGRWE